MADLASRFECIEHFRPFLAPRGEASLVETVDGLFQFRDWDDLVSRVSELFVTHLGYEAERLDVRPRLGDQKTFPRWVKVAKHDQSFAVTVAELSANVPYSNTYRPLFSVYPEGLCIAVNLRQRVVRFVFAGRGAQPSYRVLTGRWRHQDPADNLLTWCHRLNRMRPVRGETAVALNKRITETLELDPHALSETWTSRPFGGAPPGVEWADLPGVEAHAFFQQGEQRPLAWGLHRVLLARFPITVCGASPDTLLYRGCSVEPTSFRNHAGDLVRRVRLALALVEADGRRHEFEVPCVIPDVDDRGRFILGGLPCVYLPRVEDGGMFGVLPDSELEEELEDETDEEAGAGEPREPEGEAARTGDTSTRHVRQGPSIGTLLESVVARRLSAMAARFWRVSAQYSTGYERVTQAFSYWSTHEGDVALASSALLREVMSSASDLDVDASVRPVIDERTGAQLQPPSWACPEVSWRMPPGHWVPIRGARLHPAGALAVPVTREDTVRLGIERRGALESNPRFTGDPALAGVAETWVAPLLAHCAAVRPGTGSWGAAVLGAGFHVRGETVARLKGGEGPVRVVVHPSRKGELLDEPRRLRLHQVLVPVSGLDADPPVPLVHVGDVLEAAQPWLRVPASAWPDGPGPVWPRPVAALATLGQKELPEPAFLQAAPGWLAGEVVRVEVVEVCGHRGQRNHWRCVIETRPTPGPAHALTREGRCLPVSFADDVDLPFGGGSERVSAYILEPGEPGDSNGTEDGERWRDGMTGTPLVLLSLGEEQVGWVPPEFEAGTAPSVPRRLVDGSPVVEPGGAALTESRRLWLRVAHPDLAGQLDVTERVHPDAPLGWEAALGSLAVDFGLKGLEGLLDGALTMRGERLELEPSDQRSPIDVVRTRPSRRASIIPFEVGGLSWRCACGDLAGQEMALLDCPRCGLPVRPYNPPSDPSGRPRMAAPLPVRVIHPWRLRAAAGVLGLLPSELLEVIRSHGPREVLSLAERALSEDPLRALRIRLKVSAAARQVAELGKAVAGIRRLMSQGNGGLGLEHVPVVPPRLVLAGRIPGSPAFLHDPLLEQYREFSLAHEALRRLEFVELPLVRTAAEAALQESVIALYGDLDDVEPRPGTFAGLVGRLWPLGRNGSRRTTVPGLLRRGPTVHFRGVTLPAPADISPSAGCASAEGWARRAALALVEGALLRPLLGVCAGAGRARPALSALGVFSAVGINPEDNLPRVFARELLLALGSPHARPHRLLQLLDGGPSAALDARLDKASSGLEARLSAALPGDAPREVFVRATLGFLLRGWFGVPVSVEHPHGWTWCGDGAGPDDGKRAIPPLRSGAWNEWEESLPFRSPVAWLEGPGLSVPEVAAFLKGAIGRGAPAIPEALSSSGGAGARKAAKSAPVRSRETQPAAPVLPPAPAPPPGEAPSQQSNRVLRESLLEWMQTQVQGDPRE